MKAFAWQTAALAAASLLVVMMAIVTAGNLRQRGIASGFDFLGRSAGFEISPAPLSFSSHDTYARALAVGLVNTLRVAVLGGVIATALGVSIALISLSRLSICRALARTYVEIVRNTPLLLQLLIWYSLTETLPAPHDAWHPLRGVFLCTRGLFLPTLSWRGALPGFELPALSGYGFRGGLSISPEFAALLIGLSTYTAAFVAEIVRGGILAVDRGQTEAGAALGFSRGRILRLIVVPQALPIIIPPSTALFSNLAKNSSLAVAIGYPDVMSITNTTLNQTGQAVEAMALAMLAYLTISLAISLSMNGWHAALNARGHTEARA